ncbi:PA2779 family protein [Ideonella sp. 4Y16]|uniref:PA2779 family protein n=1 Tax=Ideonella alba TaxID=2824118 RepID=A0A941BGQ6_9BURK|nr:PA2779 family protein [Ideonella alba]MBQ0932342.1 PA2779 family protein [Ideonella alba]MBQ0944492.1 PA2779 family protein [Ideonella alba]
MRLAHRTFTLLLASSLSFAGFMQPAQAAGIAAEAVAVDEGLALRPAADARALIDASLARADVQAGLQARGVDLDQARARVAALSDAEAQQLARTIDSAPAGASDLVGVLVFIFVLLLVTDILGLTKVFPFTRSVR